MLSRLQNYLRTFVSSHLGFGKPAAKTFVDLVFGMIDNNSVKHKKLALTTHGKTITSSTRIVERFFDGHFISSQCLGAMIYDLLNLKQYGKLTLILDRTIWEFGTKIIDIFVATVVLGKTAIPIAIEVLYKKGGSTNFAERKALLAQIIELIGINNVEVILADREFIGEEWMSYLYQCKLPFTIRIKDNFLVEFKGAKIKAKTLMAGIKKNERCEFNVKLGCLDIRLAATLSDDGELVVVVAPRYFRGGLLKQYRVRWLIELYFRSIKSKGFNLEETHMTDPHKIKSLMAVTAIASAIAVIAGRFRNQIRKIPIKKHGRPAFSIFTYGLDLLKAILRYRIIPALSICLDPSRYSPWSELVNLLITFILGQKNVGY